MNKKQFNVFITLAGATGCIYLGAVQGILIAGIAAVAFAWFFFLTYLPLLLVITRDIKTRTITPWSVSIIKEYTTEGNGQLPKLVDIIFAILGTGFFLAGGWYISAAVLALANICEHSIRNFSEGIAKALEEQHGKVL